jgi:hypothetical protein
MKSEAFLRAYFKSSALMTRMAQEDTRVLLRKEDLIYRFVCLMAVAGFAYMLYAIIDLVKTGG